MVFFLSQMTQIYLPFLRPNCNVSSATLHRCLDEVKDWLADNLVQLNEGQSRNYDFWSHSF